MSLHYSMGLPQSVDSVLEFGQLNQLRRQTQAEPGSAASAKAEEEVARQFEALMIQQLLKQARQASQDMTPGIFDSQQTRLAQSLGDEQMAQQLATPGIGLAQALLAQMRGLSGQPEAITQIPAAASSRLPELRSSLDADAPRRIDARSITDLITKLTRNTSIGDVASAIRGAPQHIQSFVSRMSEAAHLAARDSGVPAKLILSQAALESGWGQREIRHADGSNTHNLFGIKASSSWQGKVANITTTEYVDGEPRKMQQAFRAYDSYDEAFADYARLVGGADRYRQVLQASTPEDAARRIQDAGYATDPAYADKLISIMGYLQDASGAAAKPASVLSMRGDAANARLGG